MLVCCCCCDWSVCPFCSCRRRRSKSVQRSSKTTTPRFGFLVSSFLPQFGFLTWMGQSWILSSLCLHAISECWKQRQDKAERARLHFPQRRRGVLQPADASTPRPPSRRGVSLMCAVQGSRALCRVVKSPHLTPEALRQDEDVLDSGFIVGPQARIWTHPLQYCQPAHVKPGESIADWPQNQMEFEASNGRCTTAVCFTLV